MRRARSSAGFTLIELMVVVVLISVLAVLAIPSMATAREDRLAFRTADAFARAIHEAQTRAQGRGAAQLVILTSDAALDRGKVRTYESLDPLGRPVSSCKEFNEWAGVPAGSPQNLLVSVQDANTGPNTLAVTAGIQSTLEVSNTFDTAALVCFTPGGKVYATVGPDIPTVLAALPTLTGFTGELIMTVVRRPGGVANGLSRQVIMTSGGATRIHSI